MKRLVMSFSFAVILVLSLGFVLGADTWSEHNYSGTANLNSIYCPDTNRCFVAGNGGVILENIDGINFVALSSGVGANLNSIYCDDEAICWAVGAYGRSIKTINGGSAWKDARKGLPFTTALNDVHFYNSQIGWVVGNNGKIYKTTNGGDGGGLLDWIKKDLPAGLTNPDVNLNAIYFVNDNFGWIVGDSGEIFKSTSGGDSWVNQTSNVNVKLNDVYFINFQKGFAVGNKPGLVGKATLLNTTDGGVTWTAVNLGLNANGKDFNSIYFSDANNGFIVGSGSVVFQTTDGGATWGFLSNSIDKDLNSVFLTSEHNVFVVGNGGVIWKYGPTTVPGQTYGGCTINADCDAGQQCVGGQCVPGPTLPGEIAGFPCDNDDDCPATIPICFNLKCVECYVNEHCEEGYECQSNECVDVTPFARGEQTCTDDDGGLNIFQAGTVTYDADYDDICVVFSTNPSGEAISTQVHEYVCNGDIKEDFILDCPSNTQCEEGACVFPDGTAGGFEGFYCEAIKTNGPKINVGTRVILKLNPSSTEMPYTEDPTGSQYYCDHLTLTYKKVKNDDASCNMDYECGSNSCLSGKCTAVGEILEEQMSFLIRIWCAVSNPFDFMDKDQTGESENNDYLKCLSEA